MVIAILGGRPMTLNEPRKLRAEFLRRAVADLGVARRDVAECKVERLAGEFDFITARAVARLDKLFANGVSSGPQRDEMGPAQRRKRAIGTG